MLSDKPMFIFQRKTDWNIECYITDQKSGTLTNSNWLIQEDVVIYYCSVNVSNKRSSNITLPKKEICALGFYCIELFYRT